MRGGDATHWTEKPSPSRLKARPQLLALLDILARRSKLIHFEHFQQIFGPIALLGNLVQMFFDKSMFINFQSLFYKYKSSVLTFKSDI